jgi:hypothetical protein
MRTKSKSNWLIDTLVVAAGVAAIMATTGSVRAMPIAPDVGCQVKEGGTGVKVAVLRPDQVNVWFERESSTLTETGARNLQSAIQAYEPGTVMHVQVSGVERPKAPSDHVAIDRITTISTVMALSGGPADAVVIQSGEPQLGCNA